MKIIPYDQGTKEWLDWRKKVITATDCPAIMAVHPWTTAYKRWQEKLGIIEPQQTNEAMKRGMRLEPIARAHFIEHYGINMTPVVVESSEYSFLGASLDGIDDNGIDILEIKCGGEKLHALASQGIVPEYYLYQIQHQLFVTGARKCFYYSFDGENGICIEVFPDPEFSIKFLPKAREFLKCIAMQEPPPLQKGDYLSMEDNQQWGEYARQYRDIDSTIKLLEEKKEAMRKEIINLCGNQNCLGNGIKVLKMLVKGRVVYDEIPQLKEVDLEKYRKSPTTCWKILAEDRKAS